MIAATTEKQQTLTREEAVEMANEIARLEATVKSMKAELKKYVEANGEVEANGQKWLIKPYESWSWNDSGKLKSFCKSLIVDGFTADPYTLLSVSKAKVEKLGVKEEYIENFADRKVTNKFVSEKL
ncbi:hypothetical protein JCM21714_2133 [Gracilibacillus boraciitolerans JCM 21714]|uniref:Uncharacterized protein n=1 Tax=Gracilibacillus boraciitolerans JCM 21714 TaxID=1298598 RepID=W4VIX2_9BACI|nr:hypothetical protein [Gracilibacillus boraciitolerans]GAE93096.1 hypothetical protein JCM21714_2133 [Gracilibacillus boraciitolerans JCM 21714]